MIVQYLKVKLDSTLILDWSTFRVDKNQKIDFQLIPVILKYLDGNNYGRIISLKRKCIE